VKDQKYNKVIFVSHWIWLFRMKALGPFIQFT